MKNEGSKKKILELDLNSSAKRKQQKIRGLRCSSCRINKKRNCQLIKVRGQDKSQVEIPAGNKDYRTKSS